MGAYRTTRNIEASLVDYLQTEIDKSWSGISVIVGFEEAYTVKDMPIVALFVQDTSYKAIEIGDTNQQRLPLINLNIFAKSDEQKIDLKDYIVSKLFAGCAYYKYTITSGEISTQTADGRLDIFNIADNPVVFDDMASVDAHDRHRHVISFNVQLSNIEEN